MKRKITKTNITISIDININRVLGDLFNNKSEYIEWLIYQDLKKHNVENIDKIII